ncbi:hypothetical protein Vi05172_g12163 [Venturia inaequalis]|nr:hypothetical protein Vi05172_g12163 [Venturia inaequalis]
MGQKKQYGLAANKQTRLESNKPPVDHTSTNPQPATFLTLPRELRQKILYLSSSFELTVSAHRQPFRDKRTWGLKRVGNSEMHHYRLWAQLLKIAVKDVAFWHDLDYVMEMWIEEVDDIVKRCLRKSKMLQQKGMYMDGSGRHHDLSDQQVQQQLENYHSRQREQARREKARRLEERLE